MPEKTIVLTEHRADFARRGFAWSDIYRYRGTAPGVHLGYNVDGPRELQPGDIEPGDRLFVLFGNFTEGGLNVRFATRIDVTAVPALGVVVGDAVDEVRYPPPR